MTAAPLTVEHLTETAIALRDAAGNAVAYVEINPHDVDGSLRRAYRMAAVDLLVEALRLHIYPDGHTVACPKNGDLSDACDAKCQQTRAALEAAHGPRLAEEGE